MGTGSSTRNTGPTVTQDSDKPHDTVGNVGGGYMGRKKKYKKYLDAADPPPPKKED